MRTMSRLAFTGVLFIGLALLLAPLDEASAGVTAGPAKPTTITPQEDEAAKPKPPASRPRAAPAGRVMKLDKQTAKKLDRLPANQKILVEGKEMTVGRYKTELKKEQKKSLSKLKARPAPAPPSAEALQKEFERKDSARLQAANAKVQAEMAKIGKQSGELSPPVSAEAIQSEALAIQKRLRAGNATPADHARAKELWEQQQALK